MEFWASAEVHQPASPALDKVRRLVVPFLNTTLSTSSLADLEIEIRYIPIVMPPEMHQRYKERSQARRKERVCVCAPHLDFDIFETGKFEDQVREYFRGIALSVPYLQRLGASPEQLAEFEQLIADASEAISASRH